jgi:hypothetical protein
MPSAIERGAPRELDRREGTVPAARQQEGAGARLLAIVGRVADDLTGVVDADGDGRRGARSGDGAEVTRAQQEPLRLPRSVEVHADHVTPVVDVDRRGGRAHAGRGAS